MNGEEFHKIMKTINIDMGNGTKVQRNAEFVRCLDCKHFARVRIFGDGQGSVREDTCEAPGADKRRDPIEGLVSVRVAPKDRNADCRCVQFEAKSAEVRAAEAAEEKAFMEKMKEAQA